MSDAKIAQHWLLERIVDKENVGWLDIAMNDALYADNLQDGEQFRTDMSHRGDW